MKSVYCAVRTESLHLFLPNLLRRVHTSMMIKPIYEECLSENKSSTVPIMPVNHSVPSEQTKALCVLSSSHSQAQQTHNKPMCQIYVGTLKSFVQQKRQVSCRRSRQLPNSEHQQSMPLLSHFSPFKVTDIQNHIHSYLTGDYGVSVHFLWLVVNGMEDKPQKLHALPSSYLTYNFQST